MNHFVNFSTVFIIFKLTFILNFYSNAQIKVNTWDNVSDKYWPDNFESVDIKSSVDGKIQKAIFYKSKKSDFQPLIISLHTWSGDYNQEDPIAKEVKLRDWNYIHPDFRGPNNKREACGSSLVISDIEDAVSFSIKNANVDTGNIHIIGVSGGGYTTLMAYLKLGFPVKSFNAWVPVSDLNDWYWESKGRKNKYADDLAQIATSDKNFNWVELINRSPVLLPFKKDIRKNAALNIYTGIHDGYTGSVPISHSINFYNKIALELSSEKNEILISDKVKTDLIIKQLYPYADTTQKIGNRIIHLKKELPGLSITIFEGGHEMLVTPALTLLPVNETKCLRKLNILTIGDSNGAFEYGWPRQIEKLMPFSTIINRSVAGNTIGFDNLNEKKLNTLNNIENYLNGTFEILPGKDNIDFILIGLGTNDAKSVFSDKQKQVKENLDLLIKRIKKYFEEHKKKLPFICIISPPPIDRNKLNEEKYNGSDLRIKKNLEFFDQVSKINDIDFLNIHDMLLDNLSEITSDGVHMNENTQFQLGQIAVDFINSKLSK